MVEQDSCAQSVAYQKQGPLCALVSIALALLLVVSLLMHQRNAQPFLNHGGALAIRDAALSLWERGTLAAESFQQLHQDMLAQSAACQCKGWQDVYGLAVDGRLYPNRALILSVLAAPFVGLGGEIGLWILNALLFIGVAVAFLMLTMAQSSWRTALIATAWLIFGGGLWAFNFGINYDLWALFLLFVALFLVGRYPLLAGFLLAIMVEIRPTHLLFLPLLGCAPSLQSSGQNLRQLRAAVLGAGIGLAALGTLNLIFWGSPWLTGFHRKLGYDAGGIFFDDLHPLLNLRAFFSDWGEKLFGEAGVISASPAVLLGLAGFICCRTGPRYWRQAVLGIAAAHLIIFASDPIWADDFNLVRYLSPDVALLMLGVAPLVDQVHSRS